MIQPQKAQDQLKLGTKWVGPCFIRGKKGMMFESEDMKAEIKGLFHPMKLKQVNEERPRLKKSLLIDDA